MNLVLYRGQVPAPESISEKSPLTLLAEAASQLARDQQIAILLIGGC